MPEAASGYLRRERLLAPLIASRLVVVEAGAGYGKSVLASQLREALGVATAHLRLDRADAEPAMLVSSLRRTLRAANLSDLSAAVGAGSGAVDPTAAVERLLDTLADLDEELLVVLDDAHLLGEQAAALVMRLARHLPAPHRLMVCARHLSGPLAEALSLEGALALRTQDLAFTDEEAAALLEQRGAPRAPPDTVRLLVQATHGWATALILAARSDGGGAAAPDPVATRELIAAPLRRILDALAPRERETLLCLAHLPLISPELCDLLAGDGGELPRLIEAGVPVARTDSGWWELPGPVADELARRKPLDGGAARAAADLYVREGELVPALRVLLGVELWEPAAALLERSGARGLRELGFFGLRDLLEGLPDEVVGRHPRLLLELARLAEATHQPTIRADSLERVGRLLEAASDGAGAGLRLELEAELAREQMFDGRTRPVARRLAASVIERAGPDQLIARARALDVLGRLDAWWSEGDPRPEAEQMLRESARLARRLEQPAWAAQALVPLAVGCHIGNCRYERAVAVLDEALADLPERSPYRVNVLSFQADALGELGRYREAEACLANMRAIAAQEREPWMFAYACWSEADLASREADQRRTVEAVLEAERHHDAWFEQPSGVEFLAQAADFLDRAGEHERALAYLDRARDRVAGNERVVGVCEASVLGRSGDPAAGRHATEAMLAGVAADANERWPLRLLRAFAAFRGGDPDAGQLAAEAFDACLELGHLDGPLLRERRAAEALLPVAAAAGSRAAAVLLARGAKLQIRLLGGFELRRAGRLLELPAGRPAKAVRAVAAVGGRLHAEELAELLWPGAALDLGRNRLRNLLSRLRSASGEVLVREGEVIALAAGCEVDAARFAADAHAALSAQSAGDEQRAEVLAHAALAVYQGELVPEDRYEQWAAGPREQLRMRHLELLDMLAAASERRAEIDAAVRLLSRAIDAEPYDGPRYLRLARLLASQGRVGTALSVLARARAAQAELGLKPSAELERIEGELRGRARTV